MSELDENERSLMQAFEFQDEALDMESLKKDYIAYAGKELPQGTKTAEKDLIINALKTVEDPEIMINIYDLGLVYDIRQNEENGDISVDMTVTSPMCPVAGVLPQQAADAIATIEGTGKIEVKVVWEPAWSFERLSEDAKMMMEIF
ncbi:MAG: iron-sulfur cluster assembly protein [Alphaproteobacteria bacterium]|nr:iron-sulfur cluster assembly protein [Alphaproteobacteria bacterium]